MKKVEMIYNGHAKTFLMTPGFNGRVLPGQKVMVYEENAEALSSNAGWEFVKEKANAKKDVE